MTSYDEETLGELLSALPPAPAAWVQAAKELPLALQRLEAVVDRAMQDEDYRRRVIAEPEKALEEADVVAHTQTIEIIRRRLDEDETGKK